MTEDPSEQPLLYVGSPNVGDRAIFDQLVDEIFQRRWFTNNGELVQKFERQLQEYLGVEHCIAVCNATVGLQIACKAMELSGEVIVPAYTFVATPHALKWCGLEPVFADVDLVTHNIDPKSLESRITERTSAVIGVHVWGRPCDTDAIAAIAERYNLKAMYDAAHAFGCKHGGKMIGSFGDCEVFSFHATKFFNTFEGGAIVTNDGALALKVRQMKNFGYSGVDQVASEGTNGKMSEVSAAMGIASFAGLGRTLSHYSDNYREYQRRLAGQPGLKLATYGAQGESNFQYIVVEVAEEIFGVDRDQLWRYLMKHGVMAKRYFFPGCNQMEPYKSESQARPGGLPNTGRLCKSVICLPTGTSIGPAEIKRVCDLIRVAPDVVCE